MNLLKTMSVTLMIMLGASNAWADDHEDGDMNHSEESMEAPKEESAAETAAKKAKEKCSSLKGKAHAECLKKHKG